MPNSKPPGRKPPGGKPAAHKPGGRPPASGRPRGAKSSDGWKPGGRKPGARKPAGAKHASGWSPGGPKPGGKSSSWKPHDRNRDRPDHAGRSRRPEQERRGDERSPAFEDRSARDRQFPRGRDGEEPRGQRRDQPWRETPRHEPRREQPRHEDRREQSRWEKPRHEDRREQPRQEKRREQSERRPDELPRDLVRRKPWLQMPPRRESPPGESPRRELPAPGLATSDIRRLVRDAIADAHAAGPDARRARVALAEEAGDALLQRVAAPLFRTVTSALMAEGYRFSVSTPPGAVRLSSQASGDDYAELALDTKADPPALLVRSARVRRDEGVIDERIVAEHPAIGALTDAHLLAVLLAALRPVIDR